MERLKNLKKSKSKKSVTAKVETSDTLEFGMSDEVKKKRAEIKAIKEKRRKSKLQSFQSISIL